jgi:hypothetical protein
MSSGNNEGRAANGKTNLQPSQKFRLTDNRYAAKLPQLEQMFFIALTMKSASAASAHSKTKLALEENPFPPGFKKLKNRDGFRIRAGNCRVLYFADTKLKQHVVGVIVIGAKFIAIDFQTISTGHFGSASINA